MKTYEIVMAFDRATRYETVSVEGKSYTDAYVNAEIKYPDGIITDIKEISNESARNY